MTVRTDKKPQLPIAGGTAEEPHQGSRVFTRQPLRFGHRSPPSALSMTDPPSGASPAVRSLFLQHEIDDPAAANMRRVGVAAVIQHVVAVAATLLKRIGQYRH